MNLSRTGRKQGSHRVYHRDRIRKPDALDLRACSDKFATLDAAERLHDFEHHGIALGDIDLEIARPYSLGQFLGRRPASNIDLRDRVVSPDPMLCRCPSAFGWTGLGKRIWRVSGFVDPLPCSGVLAAHP